MDNYSKIYWLTRLDNIQTLSTLVLMISLGILFTYYLVMIIECYDDRDIEQFNINWGSYKRTSFFTALIFGIFLVFIPSKNDLILIYAGGKTIDYVQKDSSLNKIPYRTTAFILEHIEKSIKELKEDKNK